MHELLIELIAYVIPPTELLGAAVVLWGCVQELVMLLRRAWQSLNRQPLHGALRDIRIAIGKKMALGGWTSSLPATSSRPSWCPARKR